MTPATVEPIPSVCRSCGAAILWMPSVRSGKAMPIDAEPVANGNIWWDAETGYARYVSLFDTAPDGAPLYLSHFATCPHAKDWRKR